MSSSSVWVQLYYKGKDEPVLVGKPDKIPTSALEDVADLKGAVKDKRQVDLSHCDAANLVVYPPNLQVTKRNIIQAGH